MPTTRISHRRGRACVGVEAAIGYSPSPALRVSIPAPSKAPFQQTSTNPTHGHGTLPESVSATSYACDDGIHLNKSINKSHLGKQPGCSLITTKCANSLTDCFLRSRHTTPHWATSSAQHSTIFKCSAPSSSPFQTKLNTAIRAAPITQPQLGNVIDTTKHKIQVLSALAVIISNNL